MFLKSHEMFHIKVQKFTFHEKLSCVELLTFRDAKDGGSLSLTFPSEKIEVKMKTNHWTPPASK